MHSISALTITVLRTAKAQPDSYGTEFVTLFPWNNNNPEGIPTSSLSFDIINPSEKETATVRLDYSDFSFGYETLPEKRQVKVFVAPQSHVTVSAFREFHSLLLFFTCLKKILKNFAYFHPSTSTLPESTEKGISSAAVTKPGLI